MGLFSNLLGTVSNSFRIGDKTTVSNKTIEANNGDANRPAMRYNESTNKWQFSNDGTTFTDMGSGSSPGGGTDFLVVQVFS
jgi:hypothetical protein